MAKKPVITADDVRSARKKGHGEIPVPPGAIISPLARDEAHGFGIRLVFSETPSDANTTKKESRMQDVPIAAHDAAVPQTYIAAVPGQIVLRAGQPLEKAIVPTSPAESHGLNRETENNLGGPVRQPGVCMIFLTEDDIRQRAISEGGKLVLSASEKLTPSAREYIRHNHLQAVMESPEPQCREDAVKPTSGAECAGSGLTHLDAATMVAKTHPRIEARGKLDNLMAEIVLTQTLFDPKDKLPALLKGCLAELKEWVFQTLAAEISGSILPGQSMAGMDTETLRAVSRNPRRYLGQDHLTPDAALGMNMAFLNRLRTQVRETELAVAKAALCRDDIRESLNRLSSAVYVLMLLTRLAENGGKLPDAALKIE